MSTTTRQRTCQPSHAATTLRPEGAGSIPVFATDIQNEPACHRHERALDSARASLHTVAPALGWRLLGTITTGTGCGQRSDAPFRRACRALKVSGSGDTSRRCGSACSCCQDSSTAGCPQPRFACPARHSTTGATSSGDGGFASHHAGNRCGSSPAARSAQSQENPPVISRAPNASAGQHRHRLRIGHMQRKNIDSTVHRFNLTKI